MTQLAISEDLARPVWKFLGVEFDPAGHALRYGSNSRHLAPMESRVLCCLVQAPSGRVLSRSELLDAVWGDRNVGDEALTVTISRLRRHFVFLGVRQPVIRTVPKAGYRLVRQELAPPRLAQPQRAAPGRSLILIALAVAGLALTMATLALVLHLT